MKYRFPYIAFTAWSFLLLYLLSWVGSLSLPDVQNLLSIDGLRWQVSSLLDNCRTIPFTETLLLLLPLSLLLSSRLPGDLLSHKPLALARRRALQTALFLLLLGMSLLLLLALWPRSPLLNSFGHIFGSPLLTGLLPLLSLLVMTVASVYGFMSGQFTRADHALHAAARLPMLLAPMLPGLLLAAQFVGAVRYVLPQLAQDSVLSLCLEAVYIYIPVAVQTFISMTGKSTAPL